MPGWFEIDLFFENEKLNFLFRLNGSVHNKQEELELVKTLLEVCLAFFSFLFFFSFFLFLTLWIRKQKYRGEYLLPKKKHKSFFFHQSLCISFKLKMI